MRSDTGTRLDDNWRTDAELHGLGRHQALDLGRVRPGAEGQDGAVRIIVEPLSARAAVLSHHEAWPLRIGPLRDHVGLLSGESLWRAGRM